MKRTTILATTLAIAGSALFAAPASADPWLTLTSEGAPITQSGQYGQVVRYDAGGCLAGPGVPGYLGQFVESTAYPDFTSHKETIVESDGTFTTESTVPLMDQTTSMTVVWYCSTSPITSVSDPSVLWASPEFEFTVEAAPPEARPLSMRSASAKTAAAATTMRVTRSKASTPVKAAADTGDGAVTLVANPDALPTVDRVAITGEKAAALKAGVDRELENATLLPRLVAFLTGKKYVAKPVSNTDYVKASFAKVTGKVPNAKVMAPFVERLDRGDLRVTVVEDIALTKNNAAYWNKR